MFTKFHLGAAFTIISLKIKEAVTFTQSLDHLNLLPVT
ncbi:unnamed protein product [Acidithrix sp. C25]|nr:unnamed protein product [Acidithrix sp. C25]